MTAHDVPSRPPSLPPKCAQLNSRKSLQTCEYSIPCPEETVLQEMWSLPCIVQARRALAALLCKAAAYTGRRQHFY